MLTLVRCLWINNQGKCRFVTFDHKPTDSDEEGRIRVAGVLVFFEKNELSSNFAQLEPLTKVFASLFSLKHAFPLVLHVTGASYRRTRRWEIRRGAYGFLCFLFLVVVMMIVVLLIVVSGGGQEMRIWFS